MSIAPAIDWANVLEAHEPTLRRLLMRRMANRQLVDDALQETYLRAVRSHGGGRAAPDGLWLRTVARRASIDLYRGEPPSAVDLEPLAIEIDAILPGSDEHLDAVEWRQAVQWALKRLSPRHRRLLTLRFVYDLTYREIAAVEHLSEEAVTAALNRARARLGVHLRDYRQRRGLAALGAMAMDWLRRARWRLQSVAPRYAEWAGATLTLGVMAVVMVAPTSAPAQDYPAVLAGASRAPSTVVDEVAATMTHATVDSSAPLGTAGGSAAAGAPDAPRPLIVSRPDVRIDSGEATARYTLEINGPPGGDSTDVTVEFHCDRGRIATTMCPIVAILGALS